MNCCGNVHVAIGFFAWFFPPLLIGAGYYQIADHYGWNGRGEEKLEHSLMDFAEYVVGFAMACVAHRVEPLHCVDVRKWPSRIRVFFWDGFREDKVSVNAKELAAMEMTSTSNLS